MSENIETICKLMDCLTQSWAYGCSISQCKAIASMIRVFCEIEEKKENEVEKQ